jgi:hypothetical protein
MASWASAGVDISTKPNPRVQADSNIERETVRSANLRRIASDGGLHVERGVARAHCVIFVGHGRAEERHDPVAHHLVHGALVAVDRLHYVLKDRIQELAGLFGVAVSEQLHRALQVGEEYGDLLALAL